MHLDVFFFVFYLIALCENVNSHRCFNIWNLIRGLEWTQWHEEIVPGHFIVAFSLIIIVLTIMDLARTNPDHIQLC